MLRHILLEPLIVQDRLASRYIQRRSAEQRLEDFPASRIERIAREQQRMIRRTDLQRLIEVGLEVAETMMLQHDALRLARRT
ncbi:hypothetical protein D1872_215600 [compost metagenome]